jgi:multimeric flavodoxin WrbA
MRICSVLGSPRPKGNTARVLGWVEDELKKSGHEVLRIDVGRGQIKPCQECYGCQANLTDPVCNIDDLAPAIFRDWLASDLILLASPLFCWGISAQLKALIDRAYCLIKPGGENGYHSILKGQRFALVMTAGDGIAENMDRAVPPHRSFVEYFNGRNAGELLIPFCTKPDELGSEVEQKARAFAQDLIGKA